MAATSAPITIKNAKQKPTFLSLDFEDEGGEGEVLRFVEVAYI